MTLALSPDRRTLAVGYASGRIILWDLVTGQSAPSLSGGLGEIHGVAFTADGKILASASDEGDLLLWDLTVRPPHPSALQRGGGVVFSVAFSPDSKTLVSGHRGGVVKFWTVATGKPMFGPQDKGLNGHCAIVIAPDNTVAAVGPDAIALFSDEGYTNNEVLRAGSVQLMSAAISPDSRTLAVGVASGNVLLWSLRERYPFEQRQPATEVFEPDVSFTAAGAIVTRIHDGTRPFHPTVEGFRTDIDGVDELRDVTTSADGAWLATAGKHAFDANHYWFGRVGLWDRRMHRLVGFPLDSDPYETTSIAFSPDGSHLAASGPHGIAQWDLASSSLRTAACRVANRNLTRSEWVTYLGAGTAYRAICLELPAGDK